MVTAARNSTQTNDIDKSFVFIYLLLRISLAQHLPIEEIYFYTFPCFITELCMF